MNSQRILYPSKYMKPKMAYMLDLNSYRIDIFDFLLVCPTGFYLKYACILYLKN